MANKKKKTSLSKLKPKVKNVSSLRSRINLVFPFSACLVILAVLVLSYFSFVDTSLAPVYAGTVRVQNNTSGPKLEKEIASSAAHYHLSLHYPDKSQKSFALKEAGITVNSKQSAKDARGYLHNHMWQRLAWWQPVHLQLAVTTNKKTLAEFIGSKATVVTVAPQDAALSAPDGVPTITPEKAGSGYRVEQASTALRKVAANLNADSLPLEKTVLKPDITAKNLEESKRKLETILSRKITFDLSGHPIIPTRAALADWVELSPVKAAKTVDVTINSGKIVAYIDKIADPYVYLPRDKLVMNMPSGPIILDSGAGGTDVSNKDDAAAQAGKQLLKGEAANISLAIKHAEAKTVELQPYDKFLVVDIGGKHMYAYEKTELVRTIPVSAGAPNTPTVLGQYKIYSKRVSQDMKGANVDGSRYFQAAVPYVNYFYGSYAIHGNYWRPKDWFGNINSSHGCVGITSPDDAWVYNWAPIGTPVIVHS